MISRKLAAGICLMAAGVVTGAAIPLTIGGTTIKPEAAAAVLSQAAPAPATQVQPAWKVNSLGQTYGDFTAVTDPSMAPDLVSVWVTPDKIGYIPSEYAFPDAEGMTLKEIRATSLARSAAEPTVIPATDSEGNVIGEFKLG